MDRPDIIRMAVDSGVTAHISLSDSRLGALENFAALVAASEREECAKVCRSMRPVGGRVWSEGQHAAFDALTAAAAAIRERGEA